MPQTNDIPAPTPVAPTQGFTLDPTVVTFQWEDVGDGAEYMLQVAADDTFDVVLLDLNVGEAVECTVPDVFVEDGATFFWRVRARHKDGGDWGPFSDPAHFTVETLEGATARPASPARPDREEDLGPAPGLLKSVAVEVAAEVTGEEEYYEMEDEMGVEHENIGVGQILGFVSAIIVTLALIIIFVFNLVSMSEQRTLEARVASGDYPQLRQTQADATNKLTQYEILNDEQRVYRIPVDRAIDLMVREARTDTARTYSPELQLRPRN
jgi:hypothetical protein